MASSFKSVWLPRLIAFTFAALAAGSAGYWILKAWGSQASGAPAVESSEITTGVSIASVTRALDGSEAVGAAASAGAAVPMQVSNRFTLVGVVAGSSRNGTALIAVDGASAKPYVVGAKVADTWSLASVQNRTAQLHRSDSQAAQDSSGNELTIHLPAPVTGPSPPPTGK